MPAFKFLWRPEKPEKPEEPEKSKKSKKPERSEKPEKPEKSKKSKKPERSEKPEKPEKPKPEKNPKEGHGDDGAELYEKLVRLLGSDDVTALRGMGDRVTPEAVKALRGKANAAAENAAYTAAILRVAEEFKPPFGGYNS